MPDMAQFAHCRLLRLLCRCRRRREREREGEVGREGEQQSHVVYGSIAPEAAGKEKEKRTVGCGCLSLSLAFLLPLSRVHTHTRTHAHTHTHIDAYCFSLSWSLTRFLSYESLSLSLSSLRNPLLIFYLASPRILRGSLSRFFLRLSVSSYAPTPHLRVSCATAAARFRYAPSLSPPSHLPTPCCLLRRAAPESFRRG